VKLTSFFHQLILRFIDIEKNRILFPNSEYRFNYGGDPMKITDLTIENLKKYHETHYRPCNALVYSYGKFF
jgi:Zn-dependent M16 (insulinase) family peptidase